jgi:hypothetical protein
MSPFDQPERRVRRRSHRAFLVDAAAFIALGALAACGKDEPARTGGATDGGATEGPPVPRFVDVLPASGITFVHHFLDSETGSTYKINPYDHGSGVFIADVNGDGLDDLYFLDFRGPNALYLNRGQMRFEDVTDAAGIGVPRSISVGAAFGDYDGDGDADLYVTTYRGGNHLFRNRGDGTFDDVTAGSGTEYDGHSNSVQWLDHDGDGDLDLYLCNIGPFTNETISREANISFYQGEILPFTEIAQVPDRPVLGERDRLFRNDGDGKFTDVAEDVGLVSTEWNGDVASADIDLDGDLDLYSSNMFGVNHLYRNEGDGRFREVTASALGRTSWGGMGARFFDANGDAYPDLYVVDMHSDMWAQAKQGTQGLRPTAKFNTPLGATNGGMIIRKPEDTFAAQVLFGNTFFVNDGDGTFTERSGEAGLENWWPWGLAIGDLNNDGHEDVFVTAGMGFPYVYWPNHLYLGDGEGRFHERARVAGIEPPREGETIPGADIRGTAFTRSSRTVAASDLDLDGDIDLVVNNFNHAPYLLRNDSPRASWIQLDLRVRGSGRPAYGARVVVRAAERTWHRWVSSAEGYLTQSSAVLHIGLGDVDELEAVEVHWLGSRTPTVIEAPAAGQRHRIQQE